MIDTREQETKRHFNLSERWPLEPPTTRSPGYPVKTDGPSRSSDVKPAADLARTDLARTLTDRYVERAMLRAITKRYPDGRWFAEFLTIPQVWASEDSEEGTLASLEAILRDWIDIKIREKDHDIPALDGIDLNVL